MTALTVLTLCRGTDAIAQAGANIEHVGAQGATALMIAASFGHAEVVSVLIERGATVDRQHAYAGTTALHFAAEVRFVQVSTFLHKPCETPLMWLLFVKS